MGSVLEMCYCSNQQAIIPNSKSIIENDINNKYDNSVNEKNNNIIENEDEKNKKKINGIINNEQNNEVETYNNISSKGAILTPKRKKEITSIKKIQKK